MQSALSGVRVAVIGAGGIGGFIAGALGRAGADVAIVARGAHLEAIRANGLTVTSAALGDFTTHPYATADPRDIQDCAIAFFAFKAHQWEPLLPQL
ncbi:MAG: hypothetical protein JO029_06470, partial [Candidatus Eremiobacteraeota bacterium]|nr:hypothetical protein [Candidatus Eremiobacteraeota bacterium]